MTRPVRNVRVLLEQRPIETERLPQLRHFLVGRALAQHRLGRVAGYEVDEGEDERRDAEQDGNREQQPPDQVSHHSIRPEGLRPSDSPTRALAHRFDGALRARGSLAALARETDIDG